MTDTDRIRARFALAHGHKAVDGDCPPLAQIVAWHEQALDSAAAGTVQSHVAHCERCFALWSGLVDLTPAPVVQAAPTPKRRWWHLAAPALAAGVVAVSLWIGLLGGEPLPAYSVDIQGGMDVRGGAEQTVLLRDQTLLQILVTPASAVEDDIEAAAYAVGPAGVTDLAVDLMVTDKGVASLEAVVGEDVAFATDTQALLIVIGRRGKLPGSAALTDALAGRSQVVRDDWQAFSVPVKR